MSKNVDWKKARKLRRRLVRRLSTIVHQMFSFTNLLLFVGNARSPLKTSITPFLDSVDECLSETQGKPLSRMYRILYWRVLARKAKILPQSYTLYTPLRIKINAAKLFAGFFFSHRCSQNFFYQILFCFNVCYLLEKKWLFVIRKIIANKVAKLIVKFPLTSVKKTIGYWVRLLVSINNMWLKKLIIEHTSCLSQALLLQARTNVLNLNRVIVVKE